MYKKGVLHNMNDIQKNTELLKEAEVFYTTFEPKTRTRFMVKITDMDGKTLIPVWLIKEITRPKVQWSSNLKKWTWLPIVLRTYDPIVPSATQMFYEYIIEETPPLFDMTIDVLSPVGDTVEKWKIHQAKFSQIDFGGLDWADKTADADGKSRLEHQNFTRYYKGSGPLEVTAVVTFEYAELMF